MKLYEKLGIKFIKYIPFVMVFVISLVNVEAIYYYIKDIYTTFYNENGDALFVLYNSPINDFLTYYFQYSWATTIPLFLLSFRMNFCIYHQIPIYFMIFNLLITQIFTSFIVSDYVAYLYSITLLLAAIAIMLSVYFYKNKKPNKR